MAFSLAWQWSHTSPANLTIPGRAKISEIRFFCGPKMSQVICQWLCDWNFRGNTQNPVVSFNHHLPYFKNTILGCTSTHRHSEMWWDYTSLWSCMSFSALRRCFSALRKCSTSCVAMEVSCHCNLAASCSMSLNLGYATRMLHAAVQANVIKYRQTHWPTVMSFSSRWLACTACRCLVSSCCSRDTWTPGHRALVIPSGSGNV